MWHVQSVQLPVVVAQSAESTQRGADYERWDGENVLAALVQHFHRDHSSNDSDNPGFSGGHARRLGLSGTE